MTIEVINTGSAPNDGTGDSLRTSFTKTNNNFSYLNSVFSGTGNISANSLTVTGNIILGDTLTFVPSGAALQYGGTANSYVQLVMQNKSSLTNASTDFVATADNGNDSSYFVDLGIASSTYYYAGYDSILPNDSYLIANGGNLLINAGSSGKAIKFVVGGSNTGNVVGQISNTAWVVSPTTESTSYATGALQVAGGVGVAGNLYVSGNIAGPVVASELTVSSATDVVILSTGNISLSSSGNLTLTTGNIVTPANYVSSGTITTGNLSASNLTLTDANATISSTGSGFTLAGIKSLSHTGSVNFGTNTTSVTAHFLSNTQSRAVFDINSNVTVTFGGTISPGYEKFLAFRNKASTTANIILPTANNNKGTTIIPVAGNVVASIWMISTDTTAANVIMTVINN